MHREVGRAKDLSAHLYRHDLVPLKSYSLNTELRAQNVTEIRDLTWQVLSITQENSADLHKVSRVPKNLATTVG
jgi:hypothetical protein